MAFREAVIDLNKLSLEVRRKVLEEHAARGIHVAMVGDSIWGDGGIGSIVAGTKTFYQGGGQPIAVVGSRYELPAVAFGCPACPHFCYGKIISGYPNLTVGGAHVAVVGSMGAHVNSCGSNLALVNSGFGKPWNPRETNQSVAKYVPR